MYENLKVITGRQKACLKYHEIMNSWFENNKDVPFGLVLGGGGARGCYEIGALEAFYQWNISFDCVAGTSIGALVGAMYTQHTSLVSFVENLSPQAIASSFFDFPDSFVTVLKNRTQIREFLNTYIFSGTGMDISPLKSEIDRLFNWEEFKNSPINFACMTFNLTTLSAEAYFKSEMTEENAKDIILASASCYPAFPVLEMNGQEYIDGGYWSNLPADLAVEMGAKKILAFDVEGPGIVQPMPEGADILLVKPMLPIGNFLDFSRDNGLKTMEAGYLETLRLLGIHQGVLFSIDKGPDDNEGFMNTYLKFMFEVHNIQVSRELIEKTVQEFVGYHDSDLSKTLISRMPYAALIEAAGFLAGLDWSKSWTWHEFVQDVLKAYNTRTLLPELPKGKESVKYLQSLSRMDVVRLMLGLLKRNDMQPGRLEQLIARLYPCQSLAAFSLYFLELAYDRSEQS